MKKGLLKRIALSGMTLVILFGMMFYAFPMDVYASTSFYLVQDRQSPWDDGVPTINEGENVLYLESSSSYCIYDYNGNGWGGFGSNINVPYAGGESTFGVGGKYFNVSQSGYYVITLTDEDDGTWFVSVLYSLAQSYTVSDIPDQTYTGSAIEPEITVTDGEKTLTLGTDYTVSYSDNIHAGTAKATITGKGNYSGTVEKTFEIVKVDIEPSSITAPIANTGLIYTGSAQELVGAGSVADNIGTMYYAVTTENTAPTDESLYTTSIPTATDAGTYYVWYKVVGDSNHLDSDAGYVTVTITTAGSSDSGASADTPTTSSETVSQTVTPATVSSISASDVKLAKGKTKNISAKVSMSDGSKYTGTATYKSANTKIATVDKNGKVKGVAGGKTTITVSAGGKSKKITVKVADIALESTSFALQSGKSTEVEATLTNDSIKSVKSSKTRIAKVSFKKNVITVKAQNKTGTAKITVTTKQGITKTITVKVQSGKVTTKSIKASTKKVSLAKKATVDITINPITSQDKVKVSVKDSKVAKATYKDGKLTITAKKKGSTTVTVQSGKKSVKITVKVKK